MRSAYRAGIAAFFDMFATIVAETKVIARLYHCIYSLCEANYALIAFIAAFVYIVELCDHSVDLYFFKEDFPGLFSYVFEGIFCSFVGIQTHYPQNDSAAINFSHRVDRVFFLKLGF